MIIDLSHEITPGMVTYPGLAAPHLEVAVSRHQPAARLNSGASFEIDCPRLTTEAVATLIGAGATIVGIDSLNIDDPGDPERPAHRQLLGAGIPIIEHLTNLESVPHTGALLIALPAPVREMASFPVRAVATWGV